MPTQPEKNNPSVVRPIVPPVAAPQRMQINVVPTIDVALVDLKKLLIADRNSAYAVRFGKQLPKPSQLKRLKQELVNLLPEDLAALREEFIQAHKRNMHNEADYQQCNEVMYEKLMSAIVRYEKERK